MYCKNCGKEIPDNSVYCSYCGTLVREDAFQKEEKVVENKITFKEATTNLFTRIFLFEGRTGQREFNFGLLFVMLLTMILSFIMTMPEANKMANEMIASNTFSEEIFYNYIDSLVSKDIFHYANLYNIGAALIYSVLLVAPVYRRMVDNGKTHMVAGLLAALFVVSELGYSNLLYCLLPDAIYSYFITTIDLLSIVNLVIILMCIFGNTKAEVK